MPLLRNPDKSKLSKRKNPTGINYYRRAGYLPEALLNYLGRMGWSMPDESEKFSLGTMIKNFDIKRVTLGGPTFDLEKLSWLNGTWIREELSDEEFQTRYQQWLVEGIDFKKLIPHVKERINILGDVAALSAYFIQDRIHLSVSDFEKNQLSVEEQVKVLQFSLWAIEEITFWNRLDIESELFMIADKLE